MKTKLIFTSFLLLLNVQMLFSKVPTLVQPPSSLPKKYYVSIVFKEAKLKTEILSILVNYGLQYEGVNLSQPLVNKLTEIVYKKSFDLMYGGVPVYGILTISKTHIEFEPDKYNAFFVDNIKLIRIPIKDIVSTGILNRGILNPLDRKFQIQTKFGTIIGLNPYTSLLEEVTIGFVSETHKEIIDLINRLKNQSK